MMPSTTGRVQAHTAERINRRIQRDMLQRLEHYRRNPAEIDERLMELDQEWDIERTLEANASSLLVGSISLALLGARKPLYLAVGVAGFLLQHALQGWCPPIEIFRRLGFRTATEIETERYALKLLRGDFDELERGSDIDVALDKFQRPQERSQPYH